MDNKVPTTPPAKVAPLSPGEMPTVIVDEDKLNTPLLNIEELKRQSNLGKINLGKRNLQAELDDAYVEDARSKRVRLALEEIKTRLERQNQENRKVEEEYSNRVNETAKMTFKLPPPKKGGRKSNKRNKKHRKKTSKRRSRK